MSEHAKFSVRHVDKGVILDVQGPVRLGESEQALREKIQELVGAGSRSIAVNLAGVTMLDSSGIGAMVRSFTSVTRGGGKFVIYSPTKMIRQTLKMVRLDTILTICDDEPSALALLQPGPRILLPATVMERSTFEQPQKLSEGIKKVYAGRVLVRNHDRALGVRLGRALPH